MVTLSKAIREFTRFKDGRLNDVIAVIDANSKAFQKKTAGFSDFDDVSGSESD